MVCGGLWWFSRFLTAHGHTDVLSSQILVVVCGGLRWCVVVCGGLWWFAVVCGGLWWIAVVCLLVIPPWAWHRHRIEGTNGFYCLIRKTERFTISKTNVESQVFSPRIILA